VIDFDPAVIDFDPKGAVEPLIPCKSGRISLSLPVVDIGI